MTATLNDVVNKKPAEQSAEQQAAQELSVCQRALIVAGGHRRTLDHLRASRHRGAPLRLTRPDASSRGRRQCSAQGVVCATNVL
jgi:hypothetical protein